MVTKVVMKNYNTCQLCASRIRSVTAQATAFGFIIVFRTPAALRLAHHYNKVMRLTNNKPEKYSASLYYNDVLLLPKFLPKKRP
jgi:hypothetical protein